MVNALVSVPLAEAIRLTRMGFLNDLDWSQVPVEVPASAPTPTPLPATAGVDNEHAPAAPGVYLDAEGDVVVIPHDAPDLGARLIESRDGTVFNSAASRWLAEYPLTLLYAFPSREAAA